MNAPLQIPVSLREGYRAGELNSSQLARALGVAPATVLKELRRLGIDTSRRTRRLLFFSRTRNWCMKPAELHRRMVEMYRQGTGLAPIARKFEFTPEGVRQILLRWGVRMRPSRPDSVLFQKRAQIKAFAARLCQLRHAAALSQVSLAERAGVGSSTVNALEKARQNPSRETVEKLATALGLGVGAFGIDHAANGHLKSSG